MAEETKIEQEDLIICECTCNAIIEITEIASRHCHSWWHDGPGDNYTNQKCSIIVVTTNTHLVNQLMKTPKYCTFKLHITQHINIVKVNVDGIVDLPIC